MGYIHQKTPPIREDRLKASEAFGGTGCAALEKSKAGCLHGSRRTFSQPNSCQLNLSFVITQTFRNAVIIVHGPIGCGSLGMAFTGSTRNFRRFRDPKAPGLVWLSTNLQEVESVMGGEERLREAILHAEKEFRPEIILVAESCVPAIIGDDIEGLIDSVQGEVSARIVPIHCAGFKTKVTATAYDTIYHGILRKLIGPYAEENTVLDEVFKNPEPENNKVNLLNVSSMSYADELELRRILSSLDLDVNVLPCFANKENFDKATGAALNISICATHDDYFVTHVEEEYGIPYVLRSIPVGIHYTNDWIRSVAKFFNKEKEAEILIERETAELKKALEPYRQYFQGKRVLISGGEIRIIALAETLEYLGLEIIGLRAYHYDKFADEMIENMPNKDTVTVNVGSNQPFEQANLLERLKPDLFIGHVGCNGTAAKHGVPIIPLYALANLYMGYAGVYETARRIFRAFKNPAYNKGLGQNAQLPYKESWYQEDPFSHIADSDLAFQGEKAD